MGMFSDYIFYWNNYCHEKDLINFVECTVAFYYLKFSFSLFGFFPTAVKSLPRNDTSDGG